MSPYCILCTKTIVPGDYVIVLGTEVVKSSVHTTGGETYWIQRTLPKLRHEYCDS